LTSAAELLRRKADDYRALGQEHASDPRDRAVYELVELTLRELADALEDAESLAEAA
jgi:hypothetical protein